MITKKELLYHLIMIEDEVAEIKSALKPKKATKNGKQVSK